jgi:hypothetical protein
MRRAEKVALLLFMVSFIFFTQPRGIPSMEAE